MILKHRQRLPANKPQPAAFQSYWMPFTANQQFKAAPRLLARAEGMYYRTTDGRDILDATSGLWCVNAGHGRREIADAIATQAHRLDYAPAFQMGHNDAFRLANRLAALLPNGLDCVFFSNSGSEAVDSALKIARAYHQARGEKERICFIGRERGYHGVGFGGLSVGGIPANRDIFEPLLPDTDHLPHTHNLENNAFSRGQPLWGDHLADHLEEIIAMRGAQTIAAVIVEPMAGSTGVLIPPRGYLQRLRHLCDRYNLLLIFDEVITGFGRLGHPFACDAFGVTPDIITLAKGLTNGAVPMGATVVNKNIYDTVIEAHQSQQIELRHGYTYSGHPLACAAALATLDLHRKEKLSQRAACMAPLFESTLHRLGDHPLIIDIRNYGLVAGIELIPHLEYPGKRAFDVYLHCFENGLLIRTTGDIIALSPPLILQEEHITAMVETLKTALNTVA